MQNESRKKNHLSCRARYHFQEKPVHDSHGLTGYEFHELKMFGVGRIGAVFKKIALVSLIIILFCISIDEFGVQRNLL